MNPNLKYCSVNNKNISILPRYYSSFYVPGSAPAPAAAAPADEAAPAEEAAPPAPAEEAPAS